MTTGEGINLAGIIATLLVTVVTLILNFRMSKRQLGAERKKWLRERQDNAYTKVITELSALAYSLKHWLEHEYRSQTDPEYEARQVPEAVFNEFRAAKTQIEHVAIEGNYFISEKSADALANLSAQLAQEPEGPQAASWDAWYDCLQGYLKAAQDCLKTVRSEARSDLHMSGSPLRRWIRPLGSHSQQSGSNGHAR